ncbi:hypothetical protein D3C86_1857400 [compost metagenome]
MTYEGTRNEKTQQVGTGSNVAFQTTNVKVVLRDPQGNPVEGTISYYDGGWLPFGESIGGEVSKELLVGTYTLSAISGGVRKQMVANTVSNSTVVFQY